MNNGQQWPNPGFVLLLDKSTKIVIMLSLMMNEILFDEALGRKSLTRFFRAWICERGVTG